MVRGLGVQGVGFRDKGVGLRFEQQVNMPSAPATLTERKKEGGGGRVQREKTTVGERGRWIERLRERWRERKREKERQKERAIARETQIDRDTNREKRWFGERSSSADSLHRSILRWE